MANPLPPYIVDALPAPPAPFGLYDVVAPIDLANPSTNSPRIQGGVQILPVNCSQSFGTWPADPCADPPEGQKKSGDRPTTDLTFLPTVVWAYDECDPQEPVGDSQALARQTLALQERLLVESAFAATLLDLAGDPGPIPTAPTFLEAIGALEEALGESGYLGAIHLSRRFAAEATMFRWTNQTGPVLKTPLGHSYVFGGGYGSVLEDTLIATGPLYLWRYPELVRTELDPNINRLATVAEREIVVGFECFIAAVTIGE